MRLVHLAPLLAPLLLLAPACADDLASTAADADAADAFADAAVGPFTPRPSAPASAPPASARALRTAAVSPAASAALAAPEALFAAHAPLFVAPEELFVAPEEFFVAFAEGHPAAQPPSALPVTAPAAAAALAAHAPAAFAAAAPTPTTLLLHDGDLVLAPTAPPAWWGGPAAVVERPTSGGRYVVERAAHDPALPEPLRAWLGRTVRLFGPAGERCLARVDAFVLRSEFVDDTPALWGLDELTALGVPDRRHDDADRLWDAGSPLTLGTLTVLSGDCAGARFARPASAPSPLTFAPAPLSARTAARALAAFRALPAWADAQRAYRDAAAAMGLRGLAPRWDRYAGARPTVSRFLAPDGRELLLVVGDSAWSCGDIGTRLSALFELAPGAPALTPRVVAAFAPDLTGLHLDPETGALHGLGGDSPATLYRLDPTDASILNHVLIADHTLGTCPC